MLHELATYFCSSGVDLVFFIVGHNPSLLGMRNFGQKPNSCGWKKFGHFWALKELSPKLNLLSFIKYAEGDQLINRMAL
jgi:hypothetical protein